MDQAKMDKRYVLALQDVVSQGGRIVGSKKAKVNWIEYDGVEYEITANGRVLIEGKPKSARLLLPKYAHLSAPHQRHPAIQRLGARQQGLMAYIRTATNNGEYLVNELLRIIFRKRTKDTDRIKAIEILISRGWGMAPQHVTIDGDLSVDGPPILMQVIQNVIADPSQKAALEQLAIAVLEGESPHDGNEVEPRIVEARPTLTDIVGRNHEGRNGTAPASDSFNATEAWEE